MKKAKECWNRDHSHNETSGRTEDVPYWCCSFFKLFAALETDITPAAANRRAHIERANITASFVGHQASLGEDRGGKAVPLRNQVSRNDGAPALRSRHAGRVSSEHHVEGDDYKTRCTPAPRTPSTRTSTPLHRNVVTNGSLTSSLTHNGTPNSCYTSIQGTCGAMSWFTEVLTNIISQTPPAYAPTPTHRPLMDLVSDYQTILTNMRGPGLSDNDRQFIKAGLESLQVELQRCRRDTAEGGGGGYGTSRGKK